LRERIARNQAGCPIRSIASTPERAVGEKPHVWRELPGCVRLFKDALLLQYRTEKWGAPVRIELREIARDGGRVEVEARLLDGNDTPCLNARDRVWFGLAR
jgi:hypothetical protein